jgi:hypothetical protein
LHAIEPQKGSEIAETGILLAEGVHNHGCV